MAIVFLTLSACQTPPAVPTPEPAPESTVSPPSAPVEPETPISVIPDCPTIEPPPPLFCPPAPKAKPCPRCPQAKVDGKLLVGAVEKVTLTAPNLTYTARIDSGAAGTSVHATKIVRFERDGKKWVRFQLDNPNGAPLTLERRVIRRVKVRQVELANFERRLKVMLNMRIGSHDQLVEFSLNNRSEMEHPILIGRNLLRNNAIVDVSQEFIVR